MFDDDDHITISYCHEGESWFEMDLYLPMLVTCPKNKMPKILNQFIKDEKCEDKAKSCWPTGSGSAISTSVTARMRQMPM